MKKLFIFVMVASLAFAQHSHDSEVETFVEAGAHVHGVATLQAVVDGDALFLDFVSPSVNLVGFEYTPNDADEIAAVESAIATLEFGDELFKPNTRAKCTLANAVAARQVEEHDEAHHHAPLFAEDGGINAYHPANHMHKGPMKSIIALENIEGNEDGLLYHAGGTHIRYDVLARAETAYFEFHALEAGDYVFFLDNAEASLHLVHEGMPEEAEMIVSGDMLHQEEDVFAQAVVFELDEGVHVLEVVAPSEVVSFVVEAQHHEHEEMYDDAHEHEGKDAGSHADEAMHSHEGDTEEEHAHEDDEHMHESDAHMHEEGAEHSEFVASYEFTCENIDRLESLELDNLFELYSGIVDLDVEYVTPAGQGATELNVDNTTLRF